MNHNFDSYCDCQKCDKKFLQEDFDLYSLTIHKTCKICNIYYKADKPWYYNCKNCHKKIQLQQIILPKRTIPCIYCKEEFYKNIKILNIVSGNYMVRHSYNNREYNTYHKLIPSHLKEEEKKIPHGIYFSKSICFNHLPFANKHINKLSQHKALRWSRITSYPPLFRLKCLKMAYISYNDVQSRDIVLKIIDNGFLVLTALLNNNFLPELRQIILIMYLD